ncbi:MAG: hypothetical protein QW190_05050 [Thermoproteota archaeon]
MEPENLGSNPSRPAVSMVDALRRVLERAKWKALFDLKNKFLDEVG